MPITPLSPRPSFEQNPKLAKAASNLSSLITAIEKKEIPQAQQQKINEIIAGANNFSGPDPELVKQLKVAQAGIIKVLDLELKLVPQNHYQLQWLVLGMAAFGIPIGVVFGTTMGNMALLGIGLPIGMAIGIAVGTSKDNQAKEEGRQLDWVAK